MEDLLCTQGDLGHLQVGLRKAKTQRCRKQRCGLCWKPRLGWSLKSGGHSNDHVEGKEMFEEGICHLVVCVICMVNFMAQGTARRLSSRRAQLKRRESQRTLVNGTRIRPGTWNVNFPLYLGLLFSLEPHSLVCTSRFL